MLHIIPSFHHSHHSIIRQHPQQKVRSNRLSIIRTYQKDLNRTYLLPVLTAEARAEARASLSLISATAEDTVIHQLTVLVLLPNKIVSSYFVGASITQKR